MARNIVRRIGEIENSESFSKYLEYGHGKPHLIDNILSNHYAVSISANHRLVFVSLNQNTVELKGVIDYHGNNKINWLIP